MTPLSLFASEFRYSIRAVFLLVLGVHLPSAAASDTIRLALNWKAEPQFGGFYEAERLGAFKSRGLKVEILEGGSGTPTIQMVEAGRTEFAIVSADELIVARAGRGALAPGSVKSDLVALFAVYQKNPQALMVRDESPHQTLRALWTEGKLLSLQSGLPYVEFLQNKYGKSKARLVPYLGGIANFVASKELAQQCFAYVEPLEAARQGIKTRVFAIADEGYNPYTTVVVARGEWVAKHQAKVDQFVQAIGEGWRSYLRDPAPTHALLIERNRALTLDSANAMAQTQKSYIESGDALTLGVGAMTLARWSELIKQLGALGRVKADTVRAADLFRWQARGR